VTTLKATQELARLAGTLDHLAVQTRGLRVTLVEFHPPGEASLIDDYWNRLDDALSKLDQARSFLEPAPVDSDEHGAFDQAGSRLGACHREMLEVAKILRDEWITTDRLREIRRLAAARRGAWVPWARLVEGELRELPHTLRQIEERFIECWELQASLESPKVLVRSIGQEFNASNIHITTTDGVQP
jgi:hypothetical protein